jgi:magnesium-transporting ATPase (P-type)
MASRKPHDTTQDFQRMSVEETVNVLKTNLSVGLTLDEVSRRLKLYGYNEVQERKTQPVILFLKKFWNLTSWMLEAIMVLSAVLGRRTDLYMAGAILVSNSVIEYVQEQKASKAVELLKRRLQVNARVLREGV